LRILKPNGTLYIYGFSEIRIYTNHNVRTVDHLALY
jgi:hypothetical protein